MNNRTEAKLTDLSGMQKAINEMLQQAWERGRKYQQRLDSVSRLQGEWIQRHCLEGVDYHTCSICNTPMEECTYDNFCPKCGARMIERSDEE